MQYLPFIVFGVGFVVLVFWLVAKQRHQRLLQEEAIALLGFNPCEHDKDDVERRITVLENNREYRFSVEHLKVAPLGRGKVYSYARNQRRQGYILAFDEFLTTLERPSEQGLLLFFKPSTLTSDTVSRAIGAMATGARDSQPDDLEKIELPDDLQGTNLIASMGPPGSRLEDLIHRSALEVLQNAGDAGVLSMHCRGTDCRLSGRDSKLSLDVEKMWELLGKLASCSATEEPALA